MLLCIDAIQQLGALPFDVQQNRCAFAMADGHKWMLGPEGLGVFYCRSDLRDQLKLHEYGWHMLEHAGDYDRTDWEPPAAHDASNAAVPTCSGRWRFRGQSFCWRKWAWSRSPQPSTNASNGCVGD